MLFPNFLHVHTIPMEKRNFIMFKKKKKKKKKFNGGFLTLVVLFRVIDEF
jgi:hypothetical protein